MAPTDGIQAAVFQAVYRSRAQRLARLALVTLLVVKHGIRGLLFSWPLYLLVLVPLMVDSIAGWWVIVFLLPAILVSGYILNMGIREDYASKVKDVILKRQHFMQLFW